MPLDIQLGGGGDASGAHPTAPAVVPTAVPGGPSADPTQQVNDQTKKILQAIMQASQRKQMANTAVPAELPGQQSTLPPPGMKPRQASFHTIGALISNAVQKQKQGQLLKAEGDWTYLQSSMNELFQAQQSGDPQAIKMAQAKVDATMDDPKKLKNMAKALNQDWLNPEKTTVYGEALKNVTAKGQKDDQQKAQAKQGLMGIFQKLMQRKQQPQLTPEQTQAMGREIQAKAPVTGGGSAKDQLDVAKGMLDLEKASKEARENYSVMVGTDGTAWAWNKSNPKDAFKLRDHESGEEIKGQVKQGSAPKVLINGGVPYAVQRAGQTLTPDSESWTKDDQKLFDGALSASREKQQLRIDPIIGDQIGEPPNPKDFAKGKSDPAYAKDLAAYGKKAENIKNEMAAVSGAARAKAFNEYRPVQVMDNDGDVYYTTAKDAISQKLAGAGEGTKLRPKEAQIKDIQVASGNARESINGLDKPFTPDQIAKLHLALTTPDDTIASAEMATLATQQLTDKQQDFVVWIKQLNERAMSLRNVAGMGAGAQDLRNAIRDMIPGVRSGSKQMMNKQLDAFDNQVKILAGGIAHPGKKDSTKSDTTKKGDPLGIL